MAGFFLAGFRSTRPYLLSSPGHRRGGAKISILSDGWVDRAGNGPMGYGATCFRPELGTGGEKAEIDDAIICEMLALCADAKHNEHNLHDPDSFLDA